MLVKCFSACLVFLSCSLIGSADERTLMSFLHETETLVITKTGVKSQTELCEWDINFTHEEIESVLDYIKKAKPIDSYYSPLLLTGDNGILKTKNGELQIQISIVKQASRPMKITITGNRDNMPIRNQWLIEDPHGWELARLYFESCKSKMNREPDRVKPRPR